MRFEFLNVELVDDLSLNFRKMEKILADLFSGENGIVNLVFVTIEEIQEMNRDYRNNDAPTDVLAFNYSGGADSNFIIGDYLIGNSEAQELVNSENIMGEILISSEYLERNQRLNREELVRMIVHGILHVLGYEHEGYFSEEDTEPEKMFVKQEKLVNKILKKI